MNICIFLNDYSPPWTEGGKNLFREIAQVLSERHKVIFIGVSNKTCVNVIDGNRSFLFRSWGYGSRFHKFSYLWGYAHLMLRGRKVLEVEVPDVIISFLYPTAAVILPWILRWLSGSKACLVQIVFADWYTSQVAPLKVWLQDHLPHYLFNNRRFYLMGLRYADRVIASTLYMKRKIAENGHSNVAYIPFGIDTKRFAPNSSDSIRDADTFVVGYMGHMTHVKGLILLLEAVWTLMDRLPISVKLAVTFGSEQYALKKYRHDRIIWHSHVDQVKFLNSCDLFVLPRRSSHGTTLYPVVLIEALACGIPVLSSDLPEVRDIINEGENGFLFKTNDVNHLRQRIEEIYMNRDKLNRIRENARETILKNFDRGKCALLLRETLEEMVSA